MDISSNSATSHSITRLLQQLPTGDEEVAARLFQFYFTEIERRARLRIKPANRRAADEEDVALSVLSSFLIAGRAGSLPEFDSREAALRELSARVRKRALDLNRYEEAVKRGGGRVVNDPAAFPNLPTGDPEPWFIVAVTDAREFLHQQIQAGLKDPIFIRIFELWTEGVPPAEIGPQVGLSRASGYRKLELIHNLATELFASPSSRPSVDVNQSPPPGLPSGESPPTHSGP